MAIATLNPATGELVKRFAPLSSADVDRKVGAAAAAAARWRATPLEERAAVVRRAGALLERDGDRYAALMTLEMGKTLRSAKEEALKCATGCAWYADNASALLSDEPVAVE